jgi:hypothetical protein
LPQAVIKLSGRQEVSVLDQSLTAADLSHTLADPVNWLNGVVSNFVSHGYDSETSAIRIGITGRGIAPNYKIEEPSNAFVLQIGAQKFEMTETPARTFNGRDYEEMTELDNLERRDENWSAAAMKFIEAKALLATLS